MTLSRRGTLASISSVLDVVVQACNERDHPFSHAVSLLCRRIYKSAGNINTQADVSNTPIYYSITSIHIRTYCDYCTTRYPDGAFVNLGGAGFAIVKCWIASGTKLRTPHRKVEYNRARVHYIFFHSFYTLYILILHCSPLIYEKRIYNLLSYSIYKLVL